MSQSRTLDINETSTSVQQEEECSSAEINNNGPILGVQNGVVTSLQHSQAVVKVSPTEV